jgi:hypothetical protein
MFHIFLIADFFLGCFLITIWKCLNINEPFFNNYYYDTVSFVVEKLDYYVSIKKCHSNSMIQNVHTNNQFYIIGKGWENCPCI